jgi:formate hydrogenlyase subunit 3/multisubunit Na+/H+ antiporter MnhD subunit
VFPFHGWIPGLVDDYEPLPVAFVLVLVPSFIGVLGLQLIDRYAFLRNSDEFFTLLRAVGILTVGAGSALVIVQRRVGRILGFAALIETGLLLLAIGSGPRTGPALYFPLTAARSAGFLAWGGGLAALHKRGMRFDRLRLLAADRATVLIGLVVLAGLFSTAGFPLLPGFPVKYRLAAVLAGIDPTAVFAVWLGMTATAAAGLRTLVSMLSSSGQAAPAEGETQERDGGQEELDGAPPGRAPAFSALLMASGCLLLLIFGLLPGWIAWLAAVMSPAFERLLR